MGCGDEKLSKYLTQTFTAHCNAMICQQVTLSGDAEWPKVADAVIEASVSIQTPADVEKVDVVEYLSALAKRELTGIARARKMSALREYFRFLEGLGGLRSPRRPLSATRH